MLLETVIILTKHKNATFPITACLEVGGKYFETLSPEQANSFITCFGLKSSGSVPTTKLNNNEGFTDYIYS